MTFFDKLRHFVRTPSTFINLYISPYLARSNFVRQWHRNEFGSVPPLLLWTGAPHFQIRSGATA